MRLLITLITALLALPALACQCPEGVKELNMERYNRYDLILTATVDSVSECTHSQMIYIQIKSLYKGTVSGKLQLSGNDCNSTCGMHMEKGKTYVIYAIHNADNTYTIPHCSGTHSILTDDEIKAEQLKLQNNPTGMQTFTHELEIWDQEQAILQKLLKPDGYLSVTYTNGKHTAHGHMVNGLPEGKWTYYLPSGHVEATGHYVKGVKEGSWTEYTYVTSEYTDATQHITTQMVHMYGTYVNGLKDGKWHKINADGTVHTYYYKQGKYVSQID